MSEEVRQASLLDADELSVLVLLRKIIQVDDARHGGCHEPRESQQAVDAVENTIQKQIPAVGLSVLQLVAGAQDEMPRDAVVQVYCEEGENGWTSSAEDHPVVSVEIEEIGHPGPATVRFDEVSTLAGPGGVAGRVAALVCRFKVVGDLQAFGLGICEGELIQHGKNEDRRDHREVADEIANPLGVEEARSLVVTKPED